MMVPSPASLLALASSLEAQGDALKAQAASIRAAVESSAQAPASDAITLEAATALLGSKRKARETFAAFEREGFEVRRVGHAAFMDRAEWDRAIASRSSKRAAAPSAPTSSPVAANDDDSPASILARAGLVPSRSPNPQRRAPKRRAA
jgi:hypothetical protein